MNFFEKILHALSGTMAEPTNFGWFHILSLVSVVVLTVLVSIKFKDTDDFTFRKILFIFWIIMVILEVYKQLIFAFEYDGKSVSWEYSWYSFPYQLCSTPMYTLPFVIFLKKGIVRDAFSAYLATFSLFAGMAVMLYPNSVFVETIGINLQTMVHHGSQVILGVFIAVYHRESFDVKRYLCGIVVFLCLMIVAVALNEIFYQILPVGTKFNMFYISPVFTCDLPVLSAIQPYVPGMVFVFIYALGFIFVATIVWLAQKLIYRAVLKKSET